MYAIDFEYDQKRLSEFHMIVCSFDGSSGMETVSSGADITYAQEKPGGSDIFHLHASSYDAPYSCTFQICKSPCMRYNPGDMYLSPAQLSEIQRWLCRDSYHPFKIAQDGYTDIYWNATFTAKQINCNGRIVGLELTMYTDAPYAYHDAVAYDFHFDTYEINNQPEAEKKYFPNLSAAEGYLYPDLEMRIQKEGTLTLTLDGRTTEIKNCRNAETITVNGPRQIISSSDPAHNIAADFNFIFPRIQRDYETEESCISANLACDITLRYSPIVLVGL